MMKISVLVLSVATCFFGPGFSAENEQGTLPSVSLEFEKLDLLYQIQYGDKTVKWPMGVSWAASAAPGWEIDWCENDSAMITVEDSAGEKAPEVRCGALTIKYKTSISLDFRCWRPSSGATWLNVEGKIPVVVSRREDLTPSVAVKLEEGVSVPLVLKNAGLGKDGKAEDVMVKLVVGKYSGARFSGVDAEGYEKIQELAVEAERPVGIRDLELQTADGTPVTAEKDYRRIWRVTERKGEVLRVSVRYSQYPQRCHAVLDGKVSLAGFLTGKDGAAGSGHERKAHETGQPAPDAGSKKHKGMEKLSAGVELTGFSLGRDLLLAEGEDPSRMRFNFKMSAKAPAVFGGGAEIKEQSLELTDSTGRRLSPAVFDLTFLSSWEEKGVLSAGAYGKSPDLASPGAEWVRVKGTLCVPMGCVRVGPVYELPLLQGAALMIPVPGASDTGEEIGDVTAAEIPLCQLKLQGVRTLKNQEMKVGLYLVVEGVPFDLDRFELVDADGMLLKNVQPGERSRSVSHESRRQSWSQSFTIGKTVNLEKLRVRLKYRTGMETVHVPVDCKVGLRGPVPQKTGNGK